MRIFDATTRSGRCSSTTGSEIPFGAAAFDAGPLRLLRSGQRVNIVMDGDDITYVTLSTFPVPQ